MHDKNVVTSCLHDVFLLSIVIEVMNTVDWDIFAGKIFHLLIFMWCKFRHLTIATKIGIG